MDQEYRSMIVALALVVVLAGWACGQWHFGRIDEAQAAERVEIATERQQLTLWAQRLVVAEITVRRQRPPITPTPPEPGDHPGIARYTIGTPTLPPEGRNVWKLTDPAVRAAVDDAITYRCHAATPVVIPAPVPWDVT